MGNLVARLARRDSTRVLCGFPDCAEVIGTVAEARDPEGTVWRRTFVVPPGFLPGVDGVWRMTAYNRRRWQWARRQAGRPGGPPQQAPRWRPPRRVRGRVDIIVASGEVIGSEPLAPAGGSVPALPCRVACPVGHESVVEAEALGITDERRRGRGGPGPPDHVGGG